MQRTEMTLAEKSTFIRVDECSISYAEGVILSVFNSLTSASGIFINLLVCVTVYYTATLRTPWAMLVCNLAVADLLNSLGPKTFNIFMFLHVDSICKLLPWQVHYASFLVSNLTNATSLATLSLLSIERCLAITFPLKRSLLMTCLRAKGLIALQWIVAVTANGLFWILEVTSTVFTTCILIGLFSCYFFIISSYSMIFIRLRKQKKVRATLQARQQADNRTQKRLAKTVGIIIGIYTLSWLPLGYVVITSNQQNYNQVLASWAFSVGGVNSSINALIYFYRNPQFRKAALKTLKRCRATSRIHPMNGTTKSVQGANP